MALTDDPNSPCLHDHDEDGMQSCYLILSEADRAKGFVRRVRVSYVHTVCGTVTSMATPIAETYARDPHFYGATWCAGCKAHYPVGAKGNFFWVNPRGVTTTEKVGT